MHGVKKRHARREGSRNNEQVRFAQHIPDRPQRAPGRQKHRAVVCDTDIGASVKAGRKQAQVVALALKGRDELFAHRASAAGVA